jgi:cellulose synthase (UDP-forming)
MSRVMAAVAGDTFLTWLWGIGFALMLCSAAIPTDLDGQRALACAIIGTLLIMRRLPLSDIARVAFLFLGAYLTARYFFWRTFETLTYYDLPSFIGSILLYLAELFGIALYLLSAFVNISPLSRLPVPLPADPADLPTVDVLVPSYNESLELLEVTLIGALQIRYPREKMRVYLLDDGGTTQKRNNPEPRLAAAAWERHHALRALCERLGVHYLAREKNEHAKAGNLNAALKVTRGELFLVLDADHVPTVDILERTVGLFGRDPKLFLVQTPHFFINPDPIEKHNSKIFGAMPGENDMFYGVIQHGLDFWNSTFFCGSAAVLRRCHVEAIGGISCNTITEDCETSQHLHRCGFTSAYIDRPMISGLQPETYTDFIVQRLRWAQGMVQLFVMNNPMLNNGLRFWQRLGYLSGSFFWFFGFARVIFLLAPAAYLLFGLRIYDANLREFLAYAVPHLIGAMLVTDFLFGRVRWAFVSEIYEILQSLFSLPAVFRVIINPRAPRFMVTPKGEQINKDFLSKLATPFYFLYMLVVAALVAGVFRFFNYPAERDTTCITMAWELLNLILLNTAIGALLESRQRRLNPRINANMPGQLEIAGLPRIDCAIEDLSYRGALLVMPEAAFDDNAQPAEAELRAHNIALGKITRLGARLCNIRKLGGGKVAVGVEFLHRTPAEKAEAVALAHGDSERWVKSRAARNQRRSIAGSFAAIVMLGSKYAIRHFALVIEILYSIALNAARDTVRHGRLHVPRYRAPELARAAFTRAYNRRKTDTRLPDITPLFTRAARPGGAGNTGEFAGAGDD